jgi:GNAT superfamily N-acetyltransferase
LGRTVCSYIPTGQANIVEPNAPAALKRQLSAEKENLFWKSDGTTLQRVPMDEGFLLFLKERSMSPNSLQLDWMIEQAIPEDAEKIATLHSGSFRSAYLDFANEERSQKIIKEATEFLTPKRIQLRAELLNHALNLPETYFYQVAQRDDSQPIGLVYGTKLDGVQEIEALYVDENYFGAGVGKALVAQFIEWADPTKPIELGVYKHNERAKKFYVKMGFEATNDNRQSHYEFIPETTMIRQPQTTQGEIK